jgi:hypothetical protein
MSKAAKHSRKDIRRENKLSKKRPPDVAKVEAALDAALAESFPASDPVALFVDAPLTSSGGSGTER